MEEKLALLKMALCRAPALTIDSSVRLWAAGFAFDVAMGLPNSRVGRWRVHRLGNPSPIDL
jgi:hypothetical protein